MANFDSPDNILTYPTIVCDNGSSSVKAGFAGEDFPRTIIPTIVGISRKEINKTGPQDIYTGHLAEQNRYIVDTIFPIAKGIITDWDAMEYIWNQMYYEDLLVPPEDYNILHTESIFSNESSREKLVETMFETFYVPNMSVLPKSMLSLYSNGLTNGLVVHSGYENTRVVPIFEGYPLEHAVRILPVGGNHISLFLMKLMNDRGYDFNHFHDLENLRNIKEKCCYFSVDYEKELAAYSQSSDQFYTLPDGTVATVGSEAFRAPEILFDPGLANIESEMGGLHNVIHDAYKACGLSEEDNKITTILLAGGNSLIPFLSDRLKQMLTSVTSPGMNVEVIEQNERKYASWIGGSILASLPDYQQMWISKREYEEKGVSVVHTKRY